MTKSSISSINKITAAAEMYFDGLTQEAIGQKLGVSRVRVSQMQHSETWQETIARLDTLKKKAEAEADRRQQLLYSSDADRRFEQGRQMVQISVVTYTKLMSVINGALDEAIANPNKSEAIKQIRIAAPLIKAAVSLGQEVYGRNYDELEALKMLADAGWLPRSILKLANEETARLKSNLRQAFTGIFPDRPDEQHGRGITPETAAALRAHILGIQPPEAEEEEGEDLI
ncbi:MULTISPECIES: sigma factor-like helix-turn-helix DNA-binding protein [unclassified Microcoleus]|uniref:sigma factor-like helix-turn-helix DNA-binding protein n=1 Tax=unclassified Microcoleus TaxID=2642155 RepID=UPI002FD62A00